MSRFKQYFSSNKNKSLFEATQKAMALLIVFSQIVAPIGPVFNLGQVQASEEGYTAELTAPEAPDSSNTYTWTIDGEKLENDPEGRKEISNVTITGCWAVSDIENVTSTQGSVEKEGDEFEKVKVEDIQDVDLPLDITVTFTKMFPSTGTADVFVKTGGGDDAGFDFERTGPSCVDIIDTGSVKVLKQVNDGEGFVEVGSEASFKWKLNGTGPWKDMGTSIADLATGSHTITEKPVAGYELAGWFIGEGSCSNPENLTPTPVAVTVNTNDTTTVTFCNELIDVNEDKIEICHATSSLTNPYSHTTPPTRQEVNKNSIKNGHGEHKGPLFPSTNEDGEWGDIIPSFPASKNYEAFDGLNWGPVGQAIWENNCEVPTEEPGPTVTLVKQLEPANDDGTFNLLIDDAIEATGGDDTTTEAVNVEAGEITVSETGANDTLLSNYTSTIACDGYEPVNATSMKIDVGQEDDITCTFTNTRNTGNLTLLKNIVNNEEGDADETDFTPLVNEQTTVQNQTIEWGKKLTLDSGKVYEADETFTNTDYEQLGVDCYATNSEEESIEHPVLLTPNSDVTCEITNSYVERGSVIVTKFHDLYLDEQYDAEPQPGQEAPDPLLDGWTVFLNEGMATERSGVTGSNENATGQYVFDGLSPGFYDLSEDLESQQGWNQSTLYCNGETFGDEINRLIVEDDLIRETGNVFVAPGQTVECFIGNFTDIELELSKSNNQTAPQQIGESIVYILEVSVPEDSGVSYNTVVTDLPPEGFEVDNSSWTATSSRNDHNVAVDVGAGPQYSSPGTWSIGTLHPGEVVTLTYTATITSDVSPGEYPDLAYATGEQFPEGTETLTYSNLHITGDNPFVETAVQVIDEQETDAVFAAARTVTITELPNTGPAWLDAILVPVGLASLYYVFTRRKWYKQIGGRI